MSSLAEALAAADNGFQVHAKLGTEAVRRRPPAPATAPTWISTGATLLIVLLCALIGIMLDQADCAAA